MRAYVEHRRVDTQQTQEQIGTTNCGKRCSCPWQIVLRKTMMERNKDVVVWESQIAITEPDEQGVDDVDEEDSTDEQ
jgi:hypothetical protein